MRQLIRKITTSRYYSDIVKDNNKQITELFSVLADQKSKDTLRGILSAYKTVLRKPGFYFTRIADGECNQFHFTAHDGYRVCGTDNPYFLNDIFTLDKETVYLDGGAYIGDTVELLLRVLNGPCKCIYAFEPNRELYSRMEARLKKYGSFIRCINAGLDNHEGQVSFLEADSGSKISPDGNQTIQVIDIKKFLNEVNDNLPTFIKLDIEGKEKDVLGAMDEFIAQKHPDLAISVYHSLDDLWEIPLLLHRLNPNYKIYLRHQSNYFTETVCYATQQ